MINSLFLILFIISVTICSAQQQEISKLLADSSMAHASVSISIIDAATGDMIAGNDPDRSLTQASLMKLITTAASIELLGSDHTFKTVLAYSGTIKKSSGILDGDIIIKGGGDPALGSEYFPAHYGNFIEKWADEISRLGIKKIKGRVVSDDSYFDYQPAPSNWTWEDIGQYYGTGVYGVSAFDNTLKIHFKTGREGSVPLLTGIEPAGAVIEFRNYLKAWGSKDEGYVFTAPYGGSGWIAGSIPCQKEDFVLKASMPDPPLLVAKTLEKKLKEADIRIDSEASATRLLPGFTPGKTTVISEILSPPLDSVIEVINHESVNLYAETLIKELGKKFKGEGSTAAGISVILEFLHRAGIKTEGLFILDGSGLSAQDAVSSRELTMLLLHMKKYGKYFGDYYNSLPEAGVEGTLKNNFKDSVFNARLKAKSGTMLRVKSYAGYLITLSGKQMIFSIIVNNFEGSPAQIVPLIEEIIKSAILYR